MAHLPDPQLRISRAKKRLTHPKFLRLYQQILAPGGTIHLKTDSPVLYRFTKRVIELYGLTLLEDSDNVTPPEPFRRNCLSKPIMRGWILHKSNRIHYLEFILPAHALPPLDGQLQEELKTTEHGAEGGD